MKTKILITLAFAVFGLILVSSNATKVSAFSCNWAGAGGTNDWSDSNNWVGTCVGGAGVPIDGDDVNITNNISTNNDIVGLTLNTLTFSGSPGGTLSGSNISINTGVFCPQAPHIISPRITAAAAHTITLDTCGYNGGVVVDGDVVSGGGVRPWGISGNVSGAGDISATDAGAIYLSGGGTGFTGSIFASGDTQLSISGTWPFGNQIHLTNGATLFGPGSEGDFVDTDGTVNYSPSRFGLDSPRLLKGAEFDFNPGDTVSLVIGGTTQNLTYDSIFNYGFGPDLTGVNLSLSLTYTPAAMDTYVLVSADGGITGTFNGLPNGSRIDIGGQSFIINYTAGSATLHAVGGLITQDFPLFTATPATPTAGQPVTINATIGSNFQIPTGTAELFDGATSLGTVTVTSGAVTFNIASFTAGSHSLTIHYSGDIVYSANVSDPLILNVSAALADTGINLPMNFIAVTLFLSLGSVLIYKKYEN